MTNCIVVHSCESLLLILSSKKYNQCNRYPIEMNDQENKYVKIVKYSVYKYIIDSRKQMLENNKDMVK